MSLPTEVHQQTLEAFHCHVGQMLDHLGQHRHPVVDAEHALLRGIDQHGDDHLVEQTGSLLDDVEVAVGHGIEGPGQTQRRT